MILNKIENEKNYKMGYKSTREATKLMASLVVNLKTKFENKEFKKNIVVSNMCLVTNLEIVFHL